MILQWLRELNVVLGLAAFCGLCYRSPQTLMFTKAKRLYLALVVFPLLVALGSFWAAAHHFPRGPVTPFFSAAYIALLVILTVWWPGALTAEGNP